MLRKKYFVKIKYATALRTNLEYHRLSITQNVRTICKHNKTR